MRIRCVTRFDITATRVSGNHSRNRLPFQDASGEDITDLKSWTRSRNRQRNWETIQQVLNLRTLLEHIDEPIKIHQDDCIWWQFGFDIETPSTVELAGDPLGAFKKDCEGVPMILGLDESADLGDVLIPGQNIIFELIHK